jgi:hypothetical protein
MFQAPPEPMLPGWTPIQQPAPRASGGEVRRWLWPATALATFATVVAYVLATSPGPGISNRGLITLVLAAIVLVVLTLRRRWGLRVMAGTLAEYAAVATLAALLVIAAPSPADQPTRANRPAQAERAATLPPVIREAVGAWNWLAEQWRRADPDAGRTPPPSTTRPTTKGKAMAAPPRTPTPPGPSFWRFRS